MDDVSDVETPRGKFVEELHGIAKLTVFHQMMEFHKGVLKYYDASDAKAFVVVSTFHAFWSLVGEELFLSPLVIGDYVMPVLNEEVSLSSQIERARSQYGAAPAVMEREDPSLEDEVFRRSRRDQE